MYNGRMAKRQFHLTEDEKKTFKRAERHTSNVHELRHLQGVRLYGSGIELRTILDIIGCSESSLREWVTTYKRKGIKGLRPGWDGKNANKLSDDQRAELAQKLHKYRPDQVLGSYERETDTPFWTVEDLRRVVQKWYSVTYKDNGSLRNLFKRCGFSYHKAEAVYKSRPSELDIIDFEAQLEKK
jgi:transposase